VRNKAFVRFPLTFHDVMLADGSPMKQPSEERMHSIFCAAGELAHDAQAQDTQAHEAECEEEENGPVRGG
jgi:hypothetical protein